MTIIPQITAKELAAKIAAGEALTLLDVREPNETDFCRIDGALVIPLGQVPSRLAEIPQDKPIVAYCHHGGRSQRAAQFLISQGFSDVANLAGGINVWSLDVDPEVPRY